jgi:hypothetical protein
VPRRPSALIGRALRSLLPIAAIGVWALVASGGGTTSSAAAHAVLVHPPLSLTSVSNDAVSSTNWSGYAVESAAAFTDVVGTWVEPSGHCSFLQPTYSSFWVGLDGYSSSSVEQLGTDVDCSWTGTPSYYAWWEMYPAGSVSLSTASYPVSPGDTMTAEVKRSGTSYTLSLHSSRGWTFTTVQSGTLANSSAEWVAEAPEVCTLVFCHGASLTNFSLVTFTGSTAATGAASSPISAFTANGGPHVIRMTSLTGASRAVPGPLVGGGLSFTDVWRSS